MRLRFVIPFAAVAAFPLMAAAQSPVADAFKADAMQEGKNLVAGAETMPADKYGFKPTPAQMSFADIVVHLSGGNDFLCGTLTGKKAPKREKIAASAGKDALVARLKETFQFCDEALSSLDDSKLGEELPMFGGHKMTRAAIELTAVGDWADHYSQMSNYLRMNGQLPPTAKKKGE